MNATIRAAVAVAFAVCLWGCSCNCNKPAATQPTASATTHPVNVGMPTDIGLNSKSNY
jgi:hypothetical protein